MNDRKKKKRRACGEFRRTRKKKTHRQFSGKEETQLNTERTIDSKRVEVKKRKKRGRGGERGGGGRNETKKFV